MPDEAAIAVLQRENSDLRDRNAQLNAESKDRRLKYKALREQHDKLVTEHQTLQADRDGWQKKAESSAPELTKQIEDLTGQLRTIRHQTAFEKKAIAARVRPEAVADLFAISGYKCDSDEPNEAALDAVFTTAKEKRAYLFLEEPKEGEEPPVAPPPKQPLVPVFGNGKGGDVSGSTRMIVKHSQMSDPAWKLDLNNQKALAEAANAGTLQFVEG